MTTHKLTAFPRSQFHYDGKPRAQGDVMREPYCVHDSWCIPNRSLSYRHDSYDWIPKMMSSTNTWTYSATSRINLREIFLFRG